MRAEVFIDQSEGGVAEISVVRHGLSSDGTARLSAHPPVAVPLISYHMLCFAKKRVSAEYILDLVPFRVMVAVMLQVP